MGLAKVTMEDGTVRNAACMGGMLTVMEGVCRLVATTWEWQEDIDFERANRAKDKAEEKLDRREHMDDRDVQLAEAKLKRALIRTSIAKL
jgi:F-type H+-transporting ATPase subunit epsilon